MVDKGLLREIVNDRAMMAALREDYEMRMWQYGMSAPKTQFSAYNVSENKWTTVMGPGIGTKRGDVAIVDLTRNSGHDNAPKTPEAADLFWQHVAAKSLFKAEVAVKRMFFKLSFFGENAVTMVVDNMTGPAMRLRNHESDVFDWMRQAMLYGVYVWTTDDRARAATKYPASGRRWHWRSADG